jgi:hypothetical protein
MKRKKGYADGGSISSDPLTPKEIYQRRFSPANVPGGAKKGGKVKSKGKGKK